MTGNGGNQNNNIFVYGKPYTILSSTRSKCFSVMAPHDQVLKIEYDAPDLVVPDGGMVEATRKAQEKEGVMPLPPGEDGLDSQWNQRMKERLDRMKSKKLRDTSITVSTKGATISSITNSRQNSSYDGAGTFVTSGSGRIREELAVTSGRIEFLTGKDSGTVEVCVQSILASVKKPARFHLRMETAASDEEYDHDDDDYAYEEVKTAKLKDPNHLEHKVVSSKISRLERDIQTLQNRVKTCLNNADHNKEQEAIFHEQSLSMNRASKYWPIIQLTVLLVTGFTQANHIVRYLKNHHIGI